MNEVVFPDTGFWIALLDPQDQHHRQAVELEDIIDDARLIVPWPTVYETLRTRLVKYPDRLVGFHHRLTRGNVEWLDDTPYRIDAYQLTLRRAPHGRFLSMVDAACILILEDVKVRVNVMISFNASDFREVCASRRIALLPGP